MKNKEMKRRKAKVKSKKSIDIYVIHNEINLLFHMQLQILDYFIGYMKPTIETTKKFFF